MIALKTLAFVVGRVLVLCVFVFLATLLAALASLPFDPRPPCAETFPSWDCRPDWVPFPNAVVQFFVVAFTWLTLSSVGIWLAIRRASPAVPVAVVCAGAALAWIAAPAGKRMQPDQGFMVPPGYELSCCTPECWALFNPPPEGNLRGGWAAITHGAGLRRDEEALWAGV